jgi:hypothetical protein
MSYTVTYKTLGKTYTSEAESLTDALSKLDVPLAFTRTTGVLAVKSKKSTVEKILAPAQSRRIFSPVSLVKEAGVKSISLLFNN